MLKQFTYAVSVFSAVAGFAVMHQKEQSSQFFEQGYPLSSQKYPAAYNAPARFDVKGGNDFYFSASFIYERPFSDDLNLVTLTSGTNPTVGTTKEMSFRFRPGFKVGAGVDLDHDNWGLAFEYARLHATNRASVNNPDGDTVVSTWFNGQIAQDTSTRFAARWKYESDLLDATLSRAFYSGTSFAICPSLGIRGGWINQHYRIRQTLDTGLVPSDRTSQKSWLIGFRPGISGNWNIGRFFRFVQDFHTGVYYQKFHLKSREQSYTDTSVIAARTSFTKSPVVMGLESFTAIGLGGYLHNDRLHLDFLAGYRFQVLTDQNYLGSVTLAQPVGQNLSLQGLELTLKLDF